jgi:predicted amidohydrolase
VQGIRSEARNAQLPINVGIHEPGGASRVKNTLLWIDANGEIAQRYQKVHLFNADIPNGPVLRESE